MTSYPNPGGESSPLGPPTNIPPDYTASSSGASNPYADPGYQTSADPGYEGSVAVPTGEALYSSQDASKTDVAKSEAADVKDTALSAGTQVAGTAKEQASNVLSEAGSQARNLLDQVRFELREQGRGQKDRLGSMLHSLSKELGQMASKSEESGPMTNLAHQASRRGGEIAHWLEDHEPADVLDEVRRFARRRPVAFLALAAAAGVVAGRLGRGAVAANTSLDSPDSGTGHGGSQGQGWPPAAQSYPAAPAYPSSSTPGYAAPQTGVMNGPGDVGYGGAGASGTTGAPGSYGTTGSAAPYGTTGTAEPYGTTGTAADPYGSTGSTGTADPYGSTGSTGSGGTYGTPGSGTTSYPPAEGGYPR